MAIEVSYRKGRLFEFMPGHCLADRKGWVAHHRRVAYEAWGPDERACIWCGRWLAWFGRVTRVDTICVDHLDGDVTNDVLANLVPACGPCNLHRAKAAWVCVVRALDERDAMSRRSPARRAEVDAAVERSIRQMRARHRPDPADAEFRRPEPK